MVEVLLNCQIVSVVLIVLCVVLRETVTLVFSLFGFVVFDWNINIRVFHFRDEDLELIPIHIGVQSLRVG